MDLEAKREGNRCRQESYRSRRQARGEVRVSTWVPRESVAEFLALAKRLRREGEARRNRPKPQASAGAAKPLVRNAGMLPGLPGDES